MLTVQCPRCKHAQKTQPRKAITKSVKRCVYCGKSFKIHSSLPTSNIVKNRYFSIAKM